MVDFAGCRDLLIVTSLSCARMRQERPTCRDVCGGAIAVHSHGKQTGQRAGEVRLLYHLWTPIRGEPSAPCALWTQADRATTAERRQTPPIGNRARMVLDLLQGLDHGW